MDFDPPRRELIEQTLQPLGNPEKERAALEKVIAAASSSYPPVTDEAIQVATRWMKLPLPRWSRLRTFLVIFLSVTVLWLIALSPSALREIYRIALAGRVAQVSSFMSRDDYPPAIFWWLDYSYVEDIVELAEKEVGGEAGISSDRSPTHLPGFGQRAAFFKSRWDAAPSDPAAYFIYALAHLSDKSRWPDDFVETGERLDPGNGWFRVCRAWRDSNFALRRDNSASKYNRWKVVDPVKFQHVLDDLEQAGTMGRLDDYRASLFRRRANQWAPPVDLPEQIFQVTQVRGNPGHLEFYDSEAQWGYYLGTVYQQILKTAAKSGDADELDRTAIRLTDLCRRFAQMDAGYFGRLQLGAMTSMICSTLVDLYGVRGEPDKAARYVPPRDAMKPFLASYAAILEKQGSCLAASSRDDFWYSPISEEDVRPGRMADYAMYEGLLLRTAAAGFAVLALACWFSSRMTCNAAGRLPERWGAFLNFRDYIAIVVLGVLLPMAIYAGFTRLLPQWRSNFLSERLFLMMVCQFVGMMVAVSLGVALAMRMILIRRAFPLGFRRGHSGIALMALTLALLAIPFSILLPYGFNKQKIDSQYAFIAVAAMTASPAVWMASAAVALLFSSLERKLPRITMLRASAPALCAASLVSLGGMFASRMEERHWVRHMDLESVRSPKWGLLAPRQLEASEKIRTAILENLPPS